MKDKHNMPREKLLRLGAQGLTANELIQVLIRSGTKKQSVRRLALNIERLWVRSDGNPSLMDLIAIPGLGIAKSASILAAIELGGRVANISQTVVNGPESLLPLVQDISSLHKEYLIMFSLNGNRQVINKHTISIGTLDSALVHPREVFTEAIKDRAAGIILVHNHPTGIAEPSDEDIGITNQIEESGYILGVNLVDHVIVTPKGNFYSFAEDGKLSNLHI